MGRKLLTLGTGPIDSSISVTQLNCDGVSSSVFCCLLWFCSLLAMISVGAGAVVVGCGDKHAAAGAGHAPGGKCNGTEAKGVINFPRPVKLLWFEYCLWSCGGT